MSIKKLFENKAIKVLPATNKKDVSIDAESVDYADVKAKAEKRFIPKIDYRDPANFAKFGSAEQYYQDTIRRIYKTYPYDGSYKEKQIWHNSSSYLDTHFFEKEYPRTNGYIKFSTVSSSYSDSWSAVSSSGYEYTLQTNPEYIFLKGGPHVDNVYTASFGQSNLRIDGAEGNTVEFWLRKTNFIEGSNTSGSTIGRNETILDVWTTSSISSSTSYGRLTIRLSGSTAGSPFRVTYMSGTYGVDNLQIGSGVTTGSVADGDWHHYAVSFGNSGNNIKTRLYVDGGLNDTVTTSGSGTIGAVDGALVATIGSLVTAPSGTSKVISRGWSRLSASMDEFRYWKTRRTDRDIKRNYFTQVGGGVNSDKANMKLGVYYKFNEGITGETSRDNTVLDYSGRVTNGTWTGYASGARFTGSAMRDSGKANTEYHDPIIYPEHPDVKTLLSDKMKLGAIHDSTNNASLYASMPSWITKDDLTGHGDVGAEAQNLKKLTQTISSYFDTLFLQIEALPSIQETAYVNYSGSESPIPFAARLLESKGFMTPEVFANANVLEHVADRDEARDYEKPLADVRNLIYQNIYNNLTYILKSKGTEKSFRNLIRCYGVDDNLIKINLYADDTTYELKTAYRPQVYKSKCIDFNHTDRNNATIYQFTASGDTNTTSYISASSKNGYIPMTYEAEIVFPKKPTVSSITSDGYYATNFVTSSLFGVHTAQADENKLGWSGTDPANFQVFAVKEEVEAPHCRFQLTGSNFRGLNLTSSLFHDVYEDEKWTFAVRVCPAKYPFSNFASGSGQDADLYKVEFYGINNMQDAINNEFYVTGTVTGSAGRDFLSNNKRLYGGAHYSGFTGSIIQSSDVKISAMRAWMSYLPNETIKAHAIDATNYGTANPYRNAHLFQVTGAYIPEIETLALNWDFQTVTSSGESSDGSATTSDAKFKIEDVSSGSVSVASRYKWLGKALRMQNTGRGDFFLPNSTDVVNMAYLNSAKHKLPETLDSTDMVQILNRDDDANTRVKNRPVNNFFAVEKSMYQSISEEMINMFATIRDFNNLIGAPVNKYRQEYKEIGKLRQLFYERIGNAPDIEKYIEYYKWIDSSLDMLLQQLIPASANMSGHVRNVIESHVLERNKYQHKFPTLEGKEGDPEAGATSINKHLYNWKFGHAPLSGLEKDNCFWWKHRAIRNEVGSALSRSSGVSADRDMILSASKQALSRSYSTPYRFVVERKKDYFLHAGTNFAENKRVDFYRGVTSFGSSGSLQMAASDVIPMVSCSDDLEPWPKDKKKLAFKAAGDFNKGDMVAPFSLYSSSVTNGYAANLSTDFRSGVDFTGLHADGIGGETPLQGPFTSHHVGGYAHRHVRMNTGSDGTDHRPEAWKLKFESNVAKVYGPEYGDMSQPRATTWGLRGEAAKRPLNIRNIKQSTGSLDKRYGNYSHNYEVVQTSGRSLNNSQVKASGTIQFKFAQSTFIDGLYDYRLPDRKKTKSVFVERFNAPGGPDVSSRGALDLVGEEFSIYNSMNYRNMAVRSPLTTLLTRRCEQFGVASGSSVSSAGYNTDAAYHKTHRNRLKRVRTTTTSHETASIYDNFWVQHPIPRSELNYRWITESVTKARALGYAPKDFYISASGYRNGMAPAYEFITSGSQIRLEHGVSGGSDFVGLNTLVVDPLDLANQKVGYDVADVNAFVGVSTEGFSANQVASDDTYGILTNGFSGLAGWTSAGTTYPDGGFRTHAGQTVSHNTGPTSGSGDSTYYIYAETSDPVAGSGFGYSYGLVTPQINASSITTVSATFDYHMFGATMGTLKVQHCVNANFDSALHTVTDLSVQWGADPGTGSFSTATSLSGQQQKALADAWRPAKINLVAYAGTKFYLRFFYTAGLSYTGDCALDNIRVYAVDATDIQQYVHNKIHVVTSSSDNMFNVLTNHRNGGYGYPSWKQIRTGERPVARKLRKSNIISVLVDDS